MRAPLLIGLVSSTLGAFAQQPASYEIALPDSVREQFQVDLGDGNTCYAFQRMFGWDSSYVEVMWTSPDQAVMNAMAYHLPFDISFVNDEAHLDDGILVSGVVAGEPNLATLVKVDDAGSIQWHKYITNVFHQQDGAGAIMPRGSEFSVYACATDVFSDGFYRIDGESTGTNWSGVDIIPPSTVRFYLSGAAATTDPLDHLLFGSAIDFTDLADLKSALINVTDTGAVWMKLYTMPPEFSHANDPLDVHLTADDNAICSGSFAYDFETYEGYVMKVDPSGDVLWCRTYADTSGGLMLKSVVELPGGDLLVAGQDKHYQCLLLRLDPTGGIIWQQRSQLPGDVWHLVDKFFTNDAGELKLALQGRMFGLTADGVACDFLDNNTIIATTYVPTVTSVVLANTPFTPLAEPIEIDVRTPAMSWDQNCIVNAITEVSPQTLRVYPIPTEDRVYLEGVNSNDRVIVRGINGALIYDGRCAGAVHLEAQPSGIYSIELPGTLQHALVVKR